MPCCVAGSVFDWCCTLTVRSCAHANITAALSACCPRLPARKDSLHLTFLPAALLFSKSPFLVYFARCRSDISPLLHSLHISLIPSHSEIKAFFSSPPAYLAARQIAPLVSKWPQQKDNDKRAVSQLSFPSSAPASHITVIDCSVSGSAIVPWDTQESCQELSGGLSFTDHNKYGLWWYFGKCYKVFAACVNILRAWRWLLIQSKGHRSLLCKCGWKDHVCLYNPISIPPCAAAALQSEW